MLKRLTDYLDSIEARDPRFYRSKTEADLKSCGAAAVEAVVED